MFIQRVNSSQWLPLTKDIPKVIAVDLEWWKNSTKNVAVMIYLLGIPNELPLDDKVDAIKDYMFSFAVENANYPTYFTEKLTDCFCVWNHSSVLWHCGGCTIF